VRAPFPPKNTDKYINTNTNTNQYLHIYRVAAEDQERAKRSGEVLHGYSKEIKIRFYIPFAVLATVWFLMLPFMVAVRFVICSSMYIRAKYLTSRATQPGLPIVLPLQVHHGRVLHSKLPHRTRGRRLVRLTPLQEDIRFMRLRTANAMVVLFFFFFCRLFLPRDGLELTNGRGIFFGVLPSRFEQEHAKLFGADASASASLGRADSFVSGGAELQYLNKSAAQDNARAFSSPYDTL
jgi:hypothetical protein